MFNGSNETKLELKEATRWFIYRPAQFTDKLREHRLQQVNNTETSSFQIALRQIWLDAALAGRSWLADTNEIQDTGRMIFKFGK